MESENDIQFYYQYVLQLVKEAGQVLLEARDINIETKDNKTWDLVTQYDRKIEDILIKQIKNKFPDHKFIGEEECSIAGRKPILTDDPTWIIDPIDGTANFVRSFPITCISVGLTINKIQTIGIIFNPYMNELFTAIKGKGAYLNGRRISTSQQSEISKSVMNYELSLAKNHELRELYMKRFKNLMTAIQGIRSLGCAALGLCYVALGTTDIYQCDGLQPWDAAAGVLIVREAGGYVCDSSKTFLGQEFDLMNPNFLAASTKKLAMQVIDIERLADNK
ncbi:PREDICTED: inositol monophosphatase 3-like [Nicrophorus vespilloides]|uniref:Inositol-1-monophosphatase n=1 Tax=Nicrophorus vespilloides TaxID=110193 RepID=A0ABM1NCI3_NICVS|nr:PREDICTED: inositol monophosphatase 3-like [Nicrophorus vespilloides]